MPRIVELLQQGVKKKRIPDHFGVSRKTVYNTIRDFQMLAELLARVEGGEK